MRWVGFTSVACLALLACSTFTAADVTGTDDAGVDAGTDSNSGADADADGATSFCGTQTGVTFCADFDGMGDVSQGWTAPELLNMGKVSKTTAESRSGTSSLDAHVEQSTADISTGRLTRAFSPSLLRIRLSFDIKLSSAPALVAGGKLSIVELACYTNDNPVTVDGPWLFYLAPATGLEFGLVTESATKFTAVPAPKIGAWTHYEIDAQWIAGSVNVRVDGAPNPITVMLPKRCSDYPNARLNLGLSAFDGTTAADAYYDNIVYEENPN